MWVAHSWKFTVNYLHSLHQHKMSSDSMLTTRSVFFVPLPNWVHTARFSQAIPEMRKRLIQILGFLITSLGWLFVLCTMAMDYWRITQLGGQGGSFIIKVAWYWSNLWKDCFTDSTAVTNCRDFGVLWAVTRKRSARYDSDTRSLLAQCSHGQVFIVALLY